MVELSRYTTSDNRVPVSEWLAELGDSVAGRIQGYIARMQAGNFGHSRSVGKGVLELKIDFGPGYRVYYVHDRDSKVVLLCGGDKGSQESDISKAHKFAEDHWRLR
ncbi:MAG: type II toxin-antitoxin system RelE/ParE family toxin [Deltaproteobacteria bacterium]|nr:type II toxin-antitoxin system RelE/ParE family toxin [Deltaproteobacteria bacterium]